MCVCEEIAGKVIKRLKNKEEGTGKKGPEKEETKSEIRKLREKDGRKREKRNKNNYIIKEIRED